MRNEREDEKLTAAEMPSLRSKLANFWYYNKIKIAFGVLAVLVLIACLITMFENREEDAVFLYAGPEQLSAEDAEQLRQALSARLPYDRTEDGEVYAGLVRHWVMMQDEIESMEAETYPENGEHVVVDKAYNASEFKIYSTYMTTGNSLVVFLSPGLYQSQLEVGRVRPLTDSLESEELLACSEDGYGLRLEDTVFYRESAAARMLPADTVVCLLRPIMIGANHNEENLNYAREIFRALVGENEG
jgi:hypothetical protein